MKERFIRLICSLRVYVKRMREDAAVPVLGSSYDVVYHTRALPLYHSMPCRVWHSSAGYCGGSCFRLMQCKRVENFSYSDSGNVPRFYSVQRIVKDVTSLPALPVQDLLSRIAI